MKQIVYLLVIALFAISLSSCSSLSDGKKVADDFYAKIKSKSYAEIVPLLSKEALANSPENVWITLFQSKEGYWGTLKSYENTYSGFKTDNGLTLIELKYKVENEKGTTYELIYLIEQDKEYMIYYYEYNQDENALGSTEVAEEKNVPTGEFATQEIVCEQFYGFIKNREFNKIQSVLSKEALDATPFSQWVTYMGDKEKNAGQLKSFSKISAEAVDYETGKHIVVKYKVEYDKNTVYELFMFRADGDNTRIKYYEYNTDLNELGK